MKSNYAHFASQLGVIGVSPKGMVIYPIELTISISIILLLYFWKGLKSSSGLVCIFYKMVNGVIVAIRICELESLFEGMHSQQFEGVQKVVLKNLRKVQIEALMLYCERNCYL